jgi:YHS domain-containing protein
MRQVAALAGVLAAMGLASAVACGGEIPAPLAPFEYLIGGWKGTGVPKANPLKGWPEMHRWAWTFAKGEPVGLSLMLDGDKVLAKGRLTFDPEAKTYRLEGTDPEGKPVAFAGTLDPKGRMLTLDREGSSPEGKERLILRLLPENGVRYVLWIDRQAPGSPRFARAVEVGLTKEGEAFAAGGGAADLPKCIITGGAASMTVSFEGKSYPICCSGCRDEFLDDPAKYIKKAALRAEGKPKAKPASSSILRDDGAFDGLVDDPEPKPSASKPTQPKAKEEPAPEKTSPTKPGPAGKAAGLLRQAQALEKAGKTAGALDYYRQVVEKFPDSAQAKTASARIKALSK